MLNSTPYSPSSILSLATTTTTNAPTTTPILTVAVQRPAQPAKVVLEEEDYVEAIEAIIERDFYPHIARLRQDNAALDAHGAAPVPLAWIRQATETGSLTPAAVILNQVRRARSNWETVTPTPDQRRVPAPSTSTGETLPPHPELNSIPTLLPLAMSAPLATGRLPGSNMSLDQFQAQYDNEDNSSFTEIIDKDNAERKRKHAWAYEAEARAQAQKQLRLRDLIGTTEGKSSPQQLTTASASASVAISAVGDPSTSPTSAQKETPNDESDSKVAIGKQPSASTTITSLASGELSSETSSLSNSRTHSNATTATTASPTDDENLQSLVKIGDSSAPSGPARLIVVPTLTDPPTAADTWHFKAKNTFMYSPDGLGSNSPPSSRLIYSEPRHIVHANTRFSEPELLKQALLNNRGYSLASSRLSTESSLAHGGE
ncbi:nuclear protein DGCR14, partial [Dimargaris cristalligena]